MSTNNKVNEVCEECGHNEFTTEQGLGTYMCHCEYPYGPAKYGLDQEDWESMMYQQEKD